ncbi:hypothetical protein L6472_11710 [Prevotella sp. E13-17]|uniref:hypothetical protein n=1 Tax=Prevotella sp. E13-17 TaxID=2913616 RepID=UPI001EDA5977|nr:hypothetical protein [Prevotella sp. E13-17]UKK50667.1 hypothetical protein L6472_11710 [Prevotella sp. E13-17]
MKRIYCTLLLALIISSVTNAQEVTMDFLKSSTWNYDGLLFQYAFTDDSIYMCYKWMCFDTTAKPYYLSSEPQRTFRDELVGKNEKGRYIIVKSNGGIILSYEILSPSEKGLNLYDPVYVNGRDAMFLERYEKYDTLRLSTSYKEQTYKRGKKYQQAYFNAFPSTWYDFERTFNGAFFKYEIEATHKQDFSHDFEKYLDAFSNLKDVDTKEYYRKLIDVTIGMPIQSTPASDKWQEIVATKISENNELVSQLLKEKSELQQARFWQFVKKDNKYLKGVVVRKKQSYIKEIWRRSISEIDVDRLYLTDSLCYYITKCVPYKTPRFETITPYKITENSDCHDERLVLTPISSSKGTRLQMFVPGARDTIRIFHMREPSLVTDTLLMAVAYRNLLDRNMDQQEMQHLFFEGFPSTWSEFYAAMISNEKGNNGFHQHANEYISAFEQLNCIPVHELLKKMVSISIGAIAQDPTSELWRTVVSDLSTRYKEELNSVLREFEPWQQTSFRQFVENKE